MNQTQQSTIQEIVTLHQEIAGHLKISLEKAIKIGELLTEQKESLRHGAWLPWIKANLPFSYKTTERYMSCYNKREKLDRVSNLNHAYSLLAPPREIYLRDECSDCRHWDEESLNDPFKHPLPEKCKRVWQNIKEINHERKEANSHV
jgi:hypothetical protein